MVTASRGGDLAGFDKAGQRLWSLNVGEQITGGVALDPLSQTAIVSTRSGKVLAFDSATGAKRWQQQLSGSVLTPALITNNRVILSANNGFLHGLSLQTGQSVWQFATQVPAISVRGAAAAKPCWMIRLLCLRPPMDAYMPLLLIAGYHNGQDALE